MSIWTHQAGGSNTADDLRPSDYCPFCESHLDQLRPHRRYFEVNDCHDRWTKTCAVCGWWVSYASLWKPRVGITGVARVYATATLREFDVLDMRLPLEVVRQYLAAQFGRRNELHPRLLEEAVASVFRDHGFEALVTSYSRDGGIDVVLCDNGGSFVGVQVKRTKNRISAEQIRSFVGALFVGGYTRGIYVTTSTFQPGALDVAKSAFVRGTPVELVDHRDLFGLLKIVRRQPFHCFEDWRGSYPDLRFAVLEAPQLAQATTGDGYRGAVELVAEQSPPEPYLLPEFLGFSLKRVPFRLL